MDKTENVNVDKTENENKNVNDLGIEDLIKEYMKTCTKSGILQSGTFIAFFLDCLSPLFIISIILIICTNKTFFIFFSNFWGILESNNIYFFLVLIIASIIFILPYGYYMRSVAKHIGCEKIDDIKFYNLKKLNEKILDKLNSQRNNYINNYLKNLSKKNISVMLKEIKIQINDLDKLINKPYFKKLISYSFLTTFITIYSTLPNDENKSYFTNNILPKVIVIYLFVIIFYIYKIYIYKNSKSKKLIQLKDFKFFLKDYKFRYYTKS